VYATAQGTINRYREEIYAITGFMAEDNGDPGQDCLDALARALTDAASEVDASLRLRYRLPLENVPPVITRVTMDIAVADLPRHGAENADLIERRAADARKFLAAVAKGDTLLDCPAASPAAAGGVAYSFPESPLAAKLKDYV
jgi:phage gp36-like protein